MNPSPILSVYNNDGNYLQISNTLVVLATTYLSRDIAAANTGQPVDNGNDFANGNVILLGQLGTENAEKLAASAATATSVTTGGAVFPHSRGEPLQSIMYDQIEISTASSQNGSYSVLATISFQWTQLNTMYYHSAGTTATWYKIKFKNSGSSVTSDYSSPAASTSFGKTTVGYQVMAVRKLTGNTSLDDDFFITAFNAARRLVDTNYRYGQLAEWRMKFDYPIKMLAGTNYVDLPSNVDFSSTDRSIVNARYSRNTVGANYPLKYIDKKDWNVRSWFNRYSFTSGTTTSGATSLILENTGDLPSAGTIYIGTETPAQSILTVTYTGNNLVTNTLTGVSGISRNLADGVQVWGNAPFTFPYFYTVFPDQSSDTARLWFECGIPTALQGKNLYIDYYSTFEDIVYMTDILPERYRDVYKSYLKFAIKRRRDDSIGEEDPDYKEFINGLTIIIGNPGTGQRLRIE